MLPIALLRNVSARTESDYESSALCASQSAQVQFGKTCNPKAHLQHWGNHEAEQSLFKVRETDMSGCFMWVPVDPLKGISICGSPYFDTYMSVLRRASFMRMALVTLVFLSLPLSSNRLLFRSS